MLINALLQLYERIDSIPQKDRTVTASQLHDELSKLNLSRFTPEIATKRAGLPVGQRVQIEMVIDSASPGSSGVFRCGHPQCPNKEQ